ncbi:Hypothetical predicted protein [Lecanosticta acicola]|uniref:SHSP domain-containing protein n=1 Tax=Lecanosticta acicola TaxID=111012 RepID=A0AAI8Z9Q7_9PEZI|nr:Hypothetical predicted protein [Lecanosticta acicola]
MPSLRYYNASAPFWDFVANMEAEHNNNNNNNTRSQQANENDNENDDRPNPWTAEGWAGFPWGPFPHRGRGRHEPHHPPPHHEGPPPPPPPPAEGDSSDTEGGPSDPRGPPPPPPFGENPDEGHEHRRGPHAHGCGPCHRGGFGGRGGHGRGRGGGPRGGPGRGRDHHFHPYAMPGPFGALAEMFQNQLFGEETTTSKDKHEDFKPEADVFDTPEAFVVHVSLPGAKKEDVGVNWDAEKSEISIAGVVYRPGDEEFLKTLALNERKVGAFERKVRLGSRANPAQVDVDAITARMEDGVLTVEVPKLDSGYVEIKKVDIE